MISRAGISTLGTGRCTADAIESHGRVSSKTRRAAGSGGTGSYAAVLVNITSLLSEGTFAVQGAALASDEFSGFLLRHLLVRIVVAGSTAVAALVRHVGQNIYVEDMC